MSKVELRIIERDKWHGKKGEDSFKPAEKSQVLVDSATNRYATGLTEEEAIKYGKILGLDLSDRYDPDNPHPYWTSNASIIIFPNATKVFDTEKPLDYVKVANLKASKFVANSMKEYEQGLFPEALYVIDDENSETERKAGKIAGKRKAMELSFKMSADEKCDIIQVINGKSVRGKSQSFLDVEIDAIIEEKPLEFVKYALMDKESIFLNALVLEALYRNVLTKEGNNICYMGDIIAISQEDAVIYFKDVNNQKIKAIIIGKMGAGRVKAVAPVIVEAIKTTEQNAETKIENAETKAEIKKEDVLVEQPKVATIKPVVKA